jgi:hypothetical protein
MGVTLIFVFPFFGSARKRASSSAG